MTHPSKEEIVGERREFGTFVLKLLNWIRGTVFFFLALPAIVTACVIIALAFLVVCLAVGILVLGGVVGFLGFLLLALSGLIKTATAKNLVSTVNEN